GGNTVSQTKSMQKEGYDACQLAFGDCSTKKLTKPLKGHLKDISPKRYLREIRDMTGFELGSSIDLTLFQEGEEVKVTGNSKGKGTAGVIKRYGFKIGNMSHGGGYPHRLIGSMGGGRGTNQGIPKGKKMPGRMGNEKNTQKSVIEKIDKENQIIFLRGAIPGHKLLMVGVKCDLETLEKRGVSRQDRVIGMAKVFYQTEEKFNYTYDLVVDNTVESPSANAKNIKTNKW
ncbi:19985_t:CDS:2, partial [Funneliformis geosporum]